MEEWVCLRNRRVCEMFADVKDETQCDIPRCCLWGMLNVHDNIETVNISKLWYLYCYMFRPHPAILRLKTCKIIYVSLIKN